MTQTEKERASAPNGPSPQAEITANGYRIIIAYRQQRLPRFIDYITPVVTSRHEDRPISGIDKEPTAEVFTAWWAALSRTQSSPTAQGNERTAFDAINTRSHVFNAETVSAWCGLRYTISLDSSWVIWYPRGKAFSTSRCTSSHVTLFYCSVTCSSSGPSPHRNREQRRAGQTRRQRCPPATPNVVHPDIPREVIGTQGSAHTPPVAKWYQYSPTDAGPKPLSKAADFVYIDIGGGDNIKPELTSEARYWLLMADKIDSWADMGILSHQR
ncbi:hypothetical protein N7499_003095 [Penicillium canescens]|nr:hypothetical protein N7499_003095 [Penicillium canescens]